MQESNLHRDKGKIPRHTRFLSHPPQTLRYSRHKLGRYILELKQHRENKLQNVDNNVSNIHQHVTNEYFQGQGETRNVDTPAPLGLLLDEAKNQRTKLP